MNYPWFREDAINYGIVNVSVANMRSQSVFQAELVNQTLLGNIVSILDKRDDYFLVQNWDGYIGWISKHEIWIGDAELARDWYESEKVMMRENYGLVYRQPDIHSEILSDLVPCTFLKLNKQNSDYLEVELPDKQVGFVSTDNFIDQKRLQKLEFSVEDMIIQARKFLGIPYLWGGNSTKGFDCSGFVQYVYAHFGIRTTRTTYTQVHQGVYVPRDKLQPGDLVFFAKRGNVHHVGLYIGENCYIHAPQTGDVVKISPLTRSDYYTARRLIK